MSHGMVQHHVLRRAMTKRPSALHIWCQRCQLSQTRVRCIATEATLRQIQSDGEETQKPQRQVLRELRGHFSRIGILSSVGIIDALRTWYPNHIVTRTPTSTGLLDLAKSGHAKAILDINEDCYSSRIWNSDPNDLLFHGPLKDTVEFGRYNYQWKGHDFIVYATSYWHADVFHDYFYILYPRIHGDIKEGRSQIVDELITAAAQEKPKVDDEIWLYDRGYWNKSRKLWESVSGFKWDDVILRKEVKHHLLNDIEGFFDRQRDYQSFAVPWKRGIIFHGLPGNGKTISIKALMNSLSTRPQPIPTLYVKSLGKNSDHDDIRTIFDHARETSPCLLVFEDIDSLVSDNVKSFFLNEVDGLEGNDGILMIGSTNYCTMIIFSSPAAILTHLLTDTVDRLDAGISKRPSRFDRKYHFALPGTSERILYCDFWKSKLARAASSLDFPSELSSAIASITEGFSFAYLQEAFITALLSIVQKSEDHQSTHAPQHAVDSSTTSSTAAGPAPSTATSAARTNSPRKDDDRQQYHHLETNPLWKAINAQVKALRRELKEGKKSVEDAVENSVLKDARSMSASTSTGFGLGPR